MQNVLLVIHLMVALALIAVVLMQRSAQDGGGLMGGGGGGGTMGGLFSARGSANLLTRTTAVLATMFIVLSLAQGIIAAHQHTTRSMADQIANDSAATPAPAAADTTKEAPKVDKAPVVPAVPVSK
ncbi:MAG: preprotein translocase subunit SecG [Bdellovibrionales bacterium]|jgi:preprotein translocase subunit SecG